MESYCATFGERALSLKDILGLSSTDLENLEVSAEDNISKHSNNEANRTDHAVPSLEWFEKAKSSLEDAFKFLSSMADVSHKILDDSLTLKATLVTMNTREINHLKRDTDDIIDLIQLILSSDGLVTRQ